MGYNYSGNGNQQQVNDGGAGSVIVHSGGVTLGQSLGETNVLVSAPGAENTKIANYTGISADGQGNSLLPCATPYRVNRIRNNILYNNVRDENVCVFFVPGQFPFCAQSHIIRPRFAHRESRRVHVLPLRS